MRTYRTLMTPRFTEGSAQAGHYDKNWFLAVSGCRSDRAFVVWRQILRSRFPDSGIRTQLDQQRLCVEMTIERIRIQNAVRDRQRRPANHIYDIEPGALVHEKRDDVIRSSMGGAVQRRVAVDVDDIHVVAALEANLDGFEGFLIRAGVLANLPNSNARRSHQRRRALCGAN